MTTQTLILGKRRFVLVPEKDFRRLEKKASEGAVRPEFAKEAIHELRTYRKTRKASNWKDVKHKLGI